jgi:hypothetical protein
MKAGSAQRQEEHRERAVCRFHHLDVHASGGAGTTDRSVPLATRMRRVDAEARRLADLGATPLAGLPAADQGNLAAGQHHGDLARGEPVPDRDVGVPGLVVHGELSA